MIEEYVEEIKQCADYIITNNRIIDSSVKQCLELLEGNAEDISNADIEEVRKILEGLVE